MQKYRYKRVECRDGFSMSVQAHNGAYCTPRENGADVYSEVEIGFPSVEEPLLMDWCEEKSIPMDTVYAYVPVGVVTTVIAKHGGMVDGEVPPGVIPLGLCSD
tara:strand:- start:3813 stop:4121 length:309 start_codon:yes stop_codon:yes gene_type:complete